MKPYKTAWTKNKSAHNCTNSEGHLFMWVTDQKEKTKVTKELNFNGGFGIVRCKYCGKYQESS